MINKHHIGKYLMYLYKNGWSELIDKRWKDEVTIQLKNQFPKITEEELNYMSFIFI